MRLPPESARLTGEVHIPAAKHDYLHEGGKVKQYEFDRAYSGMGLSFRNFHGAMLGSGVLVKRDIPHPRDLDRTTRVRMYNSTKPRGEQQRCRRKQRRNGEGC